MRIRLFPDGVFGRFLAVLIVCCASAQLVAVLLIVKSGADGASRREMAMAEEAARRVTDVLRVLESLSATQREIVVQELAGHPIVIDVARWPAPPNVQAINVQRFSGEVAVRVKARVNSAVDIQASAVDPAGSATGLKTYLIVSARRAGGPALDFHVTAREMAAAGRPAIGYPLAGQLLILLAFLSVGAYMAARRITSPLSRLAAAADALGRSLAQPPLPVSGPRELRLAAQGFNVMQERLRRYIDSRTRFVAAMSHDLRTPLTRMRLRLETLDDVRDRDEFARDLDEMQSMVIATLDALHDVGVEEPCEEIDVDELLAQLKSEFVAMGHVVTVHGSRQRPYMARPQALKRCLMNLIDNAVKYGQEASVRVEDGSKCLRIVVADRGPGIAPQYLEQVFEPFYRLESSRSRESGGAGLGLSIARDCAQAHGGTVVLRNGVVGLKAELQLPQQSVAASKGSQK